MAEKIKKTPYNDRTDLEKVRTNWTKCRGLFGRDEPSMAVVRAAIAMELSANLAIRALYAGQMTPQEINDLLLRCNGIARKFSDHIVKAAKGTPEHAAVVALHAASKTVNAERNLICHSGVFRTKGAVRPIIEAARQVILGLVQKHHPHFDLKQLPKPKKKPLTT